MQPFASSSDAASQRSSSAQGQAPSANAKPTGAPPKPAHTPDVKPRLTKEQHDILERHFQAHHKPSTSTKKGFAENLGVPLDKINNWFQNRRAKVKQDLKKQMNQYQMSMGMYPQQQVPVTMAQFPQQAPPQLSLAPGFYTSNADVSPASMPVQSIEGPSHLDLTQQQLMLQPQYDMHHSLRSIPEADRQTSYHPDAVMSFSLAASNGAPYMQNNAVSMQPHASNFIYETEPANGLPSDVQFSMTATPEVTDTAEDQIQFGDYLQYMPYIQTGVGVVDGGADDSPYSGAPSNETTQSSNEIPAGSVASITSIYSGYTDDNGVADARSAHGSEDLFGSPYNMPQASASDAALNFWQPNTQAHNFMYQQSNNSAHAVLSSPHPSERKVSQGPSDLEIPRFGDDIYARRNSSTSNLASNIEAIQIHGTPPEGFKSPIESSIAARRQKRPTNLNENTLRSASYSGGMPSPGNNNGDHTLRRIRSSGINNPGRVQKPQPGSAQRSPMSLTFSEAASSPKFQRTLSSSSITTVGLGGSLAPPTPQTPSEPGRFPYWQNNPTFRNSQHLPDHSSPESLGTNWIDPATGVFVSGESPPSGTLETAQLHQARLGDDGIYRDTPPQSAPATQQQFPRTSLMQPPRLRAAFHSSADLTLAQPKPSHIRRPSLPVEAGQTGEDPNMQYAAPAYNDFRGNDFNYEDFKDFPLSSIQHNVPFAPPVSALPDFLVHHYSPPVDGFHGHARRTTEPLAKSYIFANQGPRDFRS